MQKRLFYPYLRTSFLGGFYYAKKRRAFFSGNRLSALWKKVKNPQGKLRYEMPDLQRLIRYKNTE